MRFTKNHDIMIGSVFEHNLIKRLDVVVTIVCWHAMALVVFLLEDDDAPSVYCNHKNFCETAPRQLYVLMELINFNIFHKNMLFTMRNK